MAALAEAVFCPVKRWTSGRLTAAKSQEILVQQLATYFIQD